MVAEFRLLGDIEARIGGRRVEIGHARQRCVLVALLVDVNRPVPTAQLVDRVWADDPPHRVRNVLAGYLSRLRTLLADADEVLISREPGGYVLRTDPLTVDLHCFRSLVSRARAGSEPDAAGLFDAALDLWHGEPFAALDTPWVSDVRTALEAERLSVVLDRNDAALRAGRHAELLGELAAALQAQPLDERLAGQLMLAQYRNGRQSDALDTFRAIRERLVDELGVDPGSALRDVHQRILCGDPDRTAAAREVRPAQPRPVAETRPSDDLPRRTTSFIGREDHVADVAAALRDAPLVTLTGVGGVGKTRLALEVAATEAARFGDGAWICELAPVEGGDAVIHALTAGLRLQQQQGLTIEDSLIEFLRTRHGLLLVDNCEHVLEATARLLDRIVRQCPRVAVLATSREPLGIAGEQILPVPPLSVDDATLLFADRARAGRPDFRLDHEPAGAVAEICRRLDGLPLAIELAAARMRVMSSIDVARRLDRLRLLSGGARTAHPRQQNLIATIDWSYRLLTPPEQALFTRLSVFAGGFDLDAVHGVCAEADATEDDTLEMLTGLVDKSMVVVRGETGSTRYSLLETLRAYGRERLGEQGIDGMCAARHAAYFTGLAERASAELQGPDERAWVQRMLPDNDNLRAAFERAMAVDDTDLAVRLVTSIPELVHLRLGYESAGWAERTIERTDPGHRLFAAAVGFAARGAWNRGDHARAVEFADLARDRVPGRGTGRVAYPADVRADVALYEGDAVAALDHYRAEMERARREGDPIRLVWTLFYVAICHAALRTPDEGRAAAEEAVRVAEDTGNPTARAMAGYALGLVLKKSDPDRALRLFAGAAAQSESVHNFWWHGIALMEAAATRSVHGDAASAAAELIVVLGHWDRVGDWSQQWLNLRYVTRLLVRLGAGEDAVAVHGALVAAGKPSPLSAGQLAALPAPEPGAPLSGPQAVVRARESLARHL